MVRFSTHKMKYIISDTVNTAKNSTRTKNRAHYFCTGDLKKAKMTENY